MSKFKVGDRVEYTGGYLPARRFIGVKGVVVGLERKEGPTLTSLHVLFDNNEEHRFNVKNFRLVEETITEPTQKIVDIAKSLVYGDRGEAYGHPALDYARVAQIWSGILGHEVTPVQAIQCMIGIKLSRLSNTPDHRDSWVDIAGYAECGDRINRYEAGDEDS